MIGFGTAPLLYNKAYNKQYATQQGANKLDANYLQILCFICNQCPKYWASSTGTKVIIDIAGIGSATPKFGLRLVNGIRRLERKTQILLTGTPGTQISYGEIRAAIGNTQTNLCP